jgi:hypothetical protein
LRIAGRLAIAAGVVLLIAAIIATMRGWVGDGPRDWLVHLWSLLAGFVAAYYELFERIGKILAPFVAVASGGYAIYQKWHYAGRNLHLRLQEFLEREEKRLRTADEELDKSAARPGPARPFQAPIFSHGDLRAVLHEMDWGTPTLTTLHWSRMRRAEQEVQRASRELEEQLSLWERRKKDYQRRLVQAHLVRGAIAAARAARIKERSGDDREENQSALTEFERAMSVEPNGPDLLALELAAHQRVRLGDYTGAFDDFTRLAQLAEQAHKPVTRARALKFQAEILEFRNASQPNVNAATRLLNTALQIFPPPRGRADVIEVAELHEVQGRIRSKQPNWDWDDAALTSYTNAEGLYLQISGPDAAAALARIAEERRMILARHAPQPNGAVGATPTDILPA